MFIKQGVVKIDFEKDIEFEVVRSFPLDIRIHLPLCEEKIISTKVLTSFLQEFGERVIDFGNIDA